MRINNKENKLLHKVLFRNEKNYQLWADKIKDFNKQVKETNGIPADAGVIPVTFFGTEDLYINDLCWNMFEDWLIGLGVE